MAGSEGGEQPNGAPGEKLTKKLSSKLKNVLSRKKYVVSVIWVWKAETLACDEACMRVLCCLVCRLSSRSLFYGCLVFSINGIFHVLIFCARA